VNPRKTEEKQTQWFGIHPLIPGARFTMEKRVRKQETDSFTLLRRSSQKGRKSAIGRQFQFLLFVPKGHIRGMMVKRFTLTVLDTILRIHK